MDALQAKDSIRDLLHTLAYAEDELDCEALLSLFLPNTPFTLDLSSHLASLPPMESTPQQLWESAYQHLAGFTATQHMLGNILITFSDGTGYTKAHAKAQVRAYHCLEREEGVLESVTAHGIWEVDVECLEGRWVVRKIVIRRDVPLDRPELYEVAKEWVSRGLGRKARE